MKDPRPLSERFDLNYVRHRSWPMNWMFGLSVALALGTGIVLAIMAVRGDHRVYTAGSLTRAHAMFGNDCSKCHQPDPQRAGYWLPVSDEACLKCHDARAHPDEFRAVHVHVASVNDRLGQVAMAANCAACHTEHQGIDHPLTRINDRFCVQCHDNLNAVRKQGDATPLSLLRERAGVRVFNSPDSEPPVATTIHAFATDHPNWHVLEEKRIDTTPIRFEHLVHMNPATPQMQARLKAWIDDQKKRGLSDSQIPITTTYPQSPGIAMPGLLTLTCAACHQTDPSGRYMKPITFAEHCVQCHDLGSRTGDPVPHGSAIAAFADRIAAKQVLTPPSPVPTSGTSGGGGPRKSGPRSSSAGLSPPVSFANEKALADTLAKRVAAKHDDLIHGLKPTCAKCHGQEAEITQIPDPHIPTRWLTRAKFDHAAHAFVSCTQCHAVFGPSSAAEGVAGAESSMPRLLQTQQPGLRSTLAPATQLGAQVEHYFPTTPAAPDETTYPGEDDPNTPAGRMRWTGRTRDIMLPAIESCRVCHTPTLAGDSCVMCHDYHAK